MPWCCVLRRGRGSGGAAVRRCDGCWGVAACCGCSACCVPVLAFSGVPSAVWAQSGDVGYQGPSHSGTGTPTGTKRAESVLWWNDGSWWAHMWDTASQDFHIFRLDAATQSWVDTGVLVDPRANTHADVLWDGTHLNVSSHRFVNDGDPAVAGVPGYLYRFSYSGGTYSLDAGFPAAINDYKTETLSIDRDSTGKLWATWQQDNQIYVNHTTGGDSSWGTPFVLPTAPGVTVDDNSALIAFAGRIGVMWSNQTTDDAGMYFSSHLDGDPDAAWSPPQAAMQGAGTGDDHMNLKWLDASGGRVYAAVKTSFTAPSDPLIMLLVLDVSAGSWQSHTIARVSDCPNRVIVLIDHESAVLHTYATYPAPPAFACSSSGGAIYEKTSPLNPISFPPGRGTLRILNADSPFVHNVSSTKQNVNSQTGIAILADNGPTQTYWHAFQPLSPGAIVRESTSTTVNTTATNALTIAKPAGTAAGDVLVACLALNGGAVATGGVPAGWSPVASVIGVANPRVFGYHKNATGSEPADYQWTLASSVTSGAGIARYSGAGGLDAPATQAWGTSGLSGTVPSLTTVTANAMLVGCMGINASATSTTISSPTAMTQAWDLGGKRHELADGPQTAAGPSGSKTWTFNASRAWAGWLVALRPE